MADTDGSAAQRISTRIERAMPDARVIVRRTIRGALMRDLLVTVLLLFLSFVMLTMLVGRRAVSDLAELAIERTMDQVSAELTRFVDPVASTLEQVSQWWQLGFIDFDDEVRAIELLQPIFARTEQLSAVILADDLGRDLMVYRTTDPAILAARVHDAGRGRVHVRDAVRFPGMNDRVEIPVGAVHDLRTRPWFLRATALLPQERAAGPAGIVGWTEPYLFLTQARPGVTGSAAHRGPDGEIRVVAVDVLLDAVNEFTSTLRIGQRGQAAIMSDQGLVIGHPRDPMLGDVARDVAGTLQTAGEAGLPFAHAKENKRVDTGVRRFDAGGEAWWGEVAEYPLGEHDRLLVAVAIPEAELLRGFVTLRSLLIAVTAVIMVGAVLRSLWLAARFSRPIRGLLTETERFTQGDLAPGPPIDSDVEELVRLNAAHERMRLGLVEMMRMERDLRVARAIQRQTMPERLPVLDAFDIAAWNEPADETGGDTYDIVSCRRDGEAELRLLEDGSAEADRVFMLVADATGHGIGPALSVTQVRAMLRMAVRMGASLHELVGRLNQQLAQDLSDGRFVTAWFGELDVASGTISSLSAGQGPILRYHAADKRIEALPADLLPLGLVEDLDVPHAHIWALAPGDILAVISDGIFEALDPNDKQFGVERVCALLQRMAASPAADFIAELRKEVHTFSNGRRPADDATVLVVRRRATSANAPAP